MALAESKPICGVTAETPQETPAHTAKAYILQAIWFRAPHGADRFREYLEGANPIAARYGARRVEGLLPVETIRGNFDPDYVTVIEWPSLQHYYDFLKDLHYQTIAPLREEAVAKAVVVNCRRVGC